MRKSRSLRVALDFLLKFLEKLRQMRESRWSSQGIHAARASEKSALRGPLLRAAAAARRDP
jgi:hypothetical protein